MKILSCVKLMLLITIGWNLISCSRDSESAQVVSCNSLREIGQNEDKIKEIKVWFDKNWSDKNFRNLFNKTNDIYAAESPHLFSKIDIEWNIYGINRNFASLSISGELSRLGAPSWIALGEGRNAVFVELLGTTKLLETAKSNDKWEVIREGVYLYCDKNK